MSALPSYPLRAVHLIALWAYAVSQPIFSLLEGNPEFLVVRGATRPEVVVFALLLTFVPPLAATGLSWLVSHMWRAAGDVLYLVFLAAFVALLAMQILMEFGVDSSMVVFVAAIGGFGLVATYAKWRPLRLLLTFSAPLAVIGLTLFVARVPLVTEDVAGATVSVDRRVPVVLLVLDELPVTSLMTSTGTIDGARFPSFARLARDATWYSRATTVHESTTAATPAILTAKLPRQGELPTLSFHPENLFTLLGESYRFRVKESVSYLCPKRYCPRERGPIGSRLRGLFADVRIAYLHRILPSSLAEGLPQVDDRWGGFSKERILAAEESSDIFRAFRSQHASPPQEFAGFLAGMSRREPPATLHFLHLMLPHTPWHFLPSGRDYGEFQIPVGLAPGVFWSDRPWLVRQAFQRHLLQAGYADALLGQLLSQLERSGLYERALVVVVADHGMSFVAGEKSRVVSRSNIANIAPVPLFMKFPSQMSGRVDSRAVRTIDVLPTIADVLGVRLPWAVDGHSLLASWPEPAHVSVGKIDGTAVRASFGEIELGKATTLRRRAAFGRSWDSLLATGLDPTLLGLHMRSTRTLTASDSRVRFDNEQLFTDVDVSSPFLPVRITGTVENVEIPPSRSLAIVLNGRIAAPTRVFPVKGKQRFSALLHERFFRDGYNRVELVSIAGTTQAPRFTRIGQNSPIE